jgi:hypothetical protein
MFLENLYISQMLDYGLMAFLVGNIYLSLHALLLSPIKKKKIIMGSSRLA